MEQLQKKAVSVTHACRVLQASQSGYDTARICRRAPVACTQSVHLKAAFAASERTYGAAAGLEYRASPGAQPLMRANQLRSVWRRKFIHTTDNKHTLIVAGDVLGRQFTKALPNQAWVSDITYIRTRSGWQYRWLRHGA